MFANLIGIGGVGHEFEVSGEVFEGDFRLASRHSDAGEGDVLFESPRKVTAKDGEFSDWFAPYDVHVYKFARR